MNLLQSVFLCLVLLVIVMAGTWFYGEARYQRGVLDTEADAAEQVSQQEKIAQEALATVDRLQPKVDSLLTADSLKAVQIAEHDAEVTAMRDALIDAENRADAAYDTFEQDPTLPNCNAALESCQLAREQQSAVIDGLSESLTLKAETIILRGRQVELITTQRDSARAAAGYALQGIDEAQVVIAAKEKRIGSLTKQRNWSLVGFALALGAAIAQAL